MPRKGDDPRQLPLFGPAQSGSEPAERVGGEAARAAPAGKRAPEAAPSPVAPPTDTTSRPATNRSKRSESAVSPAPPTDEQRTLAARLSPLIYLGTSSWSFPGWAGVVYGEEATETRLARHGLAAYAQHPLLRAVGIDRTFYAPLAADDFRTYANAVPEHFRFVVKAHEAVTSPTLRGAGRRREASPQFLDAHYAADVVVAPCVMGLGAHAGPLVFQFSPLKERELGTPAAFLDRLYAFLSRLPRGPLYAVEIRNRELLTEQYAHVLRATGVAHCFAVHPSMPSPAEQAAVVDLAAAPALVARWMLNSRFDYETARVAYAPFTRLVDEDPHARNALARLTLAVVQGGRPAFIAVNNKAEGSAPLSVFKLAAHIDQLTPRG